MTNKTKIKELSWYVAIAQKKDQYGAKTGSVLAPYGAKTGNPVWHHMVLKPEIQFGTIWCLMVPHGAKKCQNGAPEFFAIGRQK